MALKFALMRRYALILLALAALSSVYLLLAIQEQESTLEIRVAAQGIAMPDGFSVWHHLDANGIRFKSITPQNDALLIKFDSSAQSAAAREVLYRTLPHGFIIAQQEDDNQAAAWLTRLRNDIRLLG